MNYMQGIDDIDCSVYRMAMGPSGCKKTPSTKCDDYITIVFELIGLNER